MTLPPAETIQQEPAGEPSDFALGFAFACLALGFVAAVLFGTGVVRV